MKQIHFFATKEDLLPMLELVECKGSLSYSLTGNFSRNEFQDGISTFNAGAQIPRLGHAGGDSSTICDGFLVCDQEATINLRFVDSDDQGGRICLDQLANPDSIVFLPGGIWDTDVIIQGHVGTASDSKIAKVLMKQFEAGIKTVFTKLKAFYVGPNAMACLQKGERLTSSARSPREYDLTQ